MSLSHPLPIGYDNPAMEPSDPSARLIPHHMERRTFLAALAGGLLAAPLAAEAQQVGKVYRVGILSTGNPRSAFFFQAFEQRLRELGYVEGRNLAIEFRNAEGRTDRLPSLAAELVRLNVDVVVVATDPATRAVKEASAKIPIVIVSVNYDPVELGYIDSLARPGTNVTQAQQAKTPPRIGFLLMGSSQAGLTFAFDAFREGLRELGRTENENIAIEYRWAGESPHRLPELVADLVRLKVDIIIGSTPGVRAAQHATMNIPIIMCIADDAVKQGFVPNLARPGGNITGMAAFASEFAGKRLELLREATPRVSRVALLWNPPGSSPDYMKDTQMAARLLGVTLQSVEIQTADDFERAFASILKGRAEALVVGPGQFLFTHERGVVEFALKNRLPSIYAWRDAVSAEGLMAYGVNIPQVYRRAAYYVDKILRGTKPGDLPVEQTTKFDLVINAKTAKALGLTVPRSLLSRADEVIACPEKAGASRGC